MSPLPLSKSSAVSPDTHRVFQDELETEANSGVIFPQVLGLKLNPTKAPKIQGFGWNLGLRYKHSPSQKSMTWIISKDERQGLFEIYRQKFHCVYGFVDIHNVLLESSRRWQDPYATNAYDHVLPGVAALACLFSSEKTDDRERLLVECAKDILESTSLVKDPTFHDAQAWLLRTLYLRCNSPPHAAWMASCTTMQIVEATGIHREASESTADAECRRRTFWLAQLLNTWISFEYGRSRVSPQGATCQLPTPKLGDGTSDLIMLFTISAVLDPGKNNGPLEMENALVQVENFDFSLTPVVLSQSSLCFAIYRRLRLATADVKHELLEKVITVGCKGLKASLSALQSGSPWWHVPNVPFQFTCILLAMNTPESLLHVNQAISTLRTVVHHCKTPVMQKALSTVELLVQLSQKRKEQEILPLQNAVSSQSEEDTHFSHNVNITQPEDAVTDFMWSNELLWNTPSLDNVDWNQFWTEPFGFSTPRLPLD